MSFEIILSVLVSALLLFYLARVAASGEVLR